MKPKSRKGTSGKPARRQAKDWRPAVKLLTDFLSSVDPIERSEGQLGELFFLSRALEALKGPVRFAETWVCPADLPEFLAEVEKCVRAIGDLIDARFQEYPLVLSGKDDRECAHSTMMGLQDVRLNLRLLDKLRAQTRTAAVFSVEGEELRRLRAGELKTDPPLDSKGEQP